MERSTGPTERRTRVALDETLERITSPDEAKQVVQQIERDVSRSTEAEQGAGVARAGGPGAGERPTPRPQDAAASLEAVAAEAVAPTAEAGAVVRAAQKALGPRAWPGPPARRRGRRLLEEAVLRRMGPLEALDARLFLVLNTDAPRWPWLDRLAKAITLTASGGWAWVIGLVVARIAGVQQAGPALRVLALVLLIVNNVVEHIVKAYFRRRRPFIDVVRALVVGKQPGGWSFPSGHAAVSSAAALLLSTYWPRLWPLFATLASLVGLSRIYVGAHYPGDVLAGGAIGAALVMPIWRLARRLPWVGR